MNRLLLLLLLSAITLQSLSQSALLNKERVKWMPFQWEGDEALPKSSMMVKTKIDTLDYNFKWQFDTGSPYTFLYGITWQKFTNHYNWLNSRFSVVDSFSQAPYKKIKSPSIAAGDSKLPGRTILINPDYGDDFPQEYVSQYKGANFLIGTIGIDKFRDRVLIIDFKNNRIGTAALLSDTFYQKNTAVDFIVYQNRIILPVKIGKKSYRFFYDSGASLFPLKTTAVLATQLPPVNITDTLHNITTWGKSYDVPGGRVSSSIEIAGVNLQQALIYVHPDPEGYHTEIFREAGVQGLIGNQPFDQKTIIIDFTRNKFTVLQ